MAPPATDRSAAAAAIDAFVRALGLDPARDPELAGTGERVAAAFIDELCAGYGVDVAALLAKDAMPGQSGPVIVRDIDFAITCPHHLMTAVGKADVAFAPNERIVGIGAVAHAVVTLGRRLVLQERVGEDVVDALMKALAPSWAACRIDLAHGCMNARGENMHHAHVETLAVRGAITVVDAATLLSGSGSGSGDRKGAS